MSKPFRRLRSQSILGQTLLDVLIRFANYLLLTSNQRRQIAECLIRFSSFATRHFRYILTKRSDLQKINVGIKAVAHGLSPCVVSQNIPIDQVQLIKVDGWLIDVRAWVPRALENMGLFLGSVDGRNPFDIRNILA